MGTNFYLQNKKPRLVHDLTHIAKTSAGWQPVFECHAGEIESVRQLKTAYDSGEYTIVDEYGDEYDWDEFDQRVLQWGDRPDVEPICHVDYERNHPDRFFTEPMHYHDEDGYDFCTREFS